jgi:hypothetical protein
MRKKLPIGDRPYYIRFMAATHLRIERERKTVEALTRIFCRNSHRRDLCPECIELLIYAGKRLDKCPYGERKPACADCPVHCYKPDMRERIRAVMRHAGPRMVWRHPVLAVFHLIDALRMAPLSSAPKACGK